MRFHDVKNVFFVAFNKNGIVAKNYFGDGRMTTKTARAKLEKSYPDCEFIVSKKYHSFCGDNYEWMVENAMKRIEEIKAEEVAEEVKETTATAKTENSDVNFWDDKTVEKLNNYAKETSKFWNDFYKDRTLVAVSYNKEKKERTYKMTLHFEHFDCNFKVTVGKYYKIKSELLES